MTQRASAASPCIGTCRIDPTNRLCAGCLRNLDEITGWHAADAAEREQILARCAQRRAAAEALQKAVRR